MVSQRNASSEVDDLNSKDLSLIRIPLMILLSLNKDIGK